MKCLLNLLSIVLMVCLLCSICSSCSLTASTKDRIVANDIVSQFESESHNMDEIDKPVLTGDNTSNEQTSVAQTESQATFSELINDNPIDKEYNNNNSNQETTMDMVQYEKKYAEIWLNELEYSCNNLLSRLTSEDAENFELIQEAWMTNFLDNYEFINGMLNNEAYDIHVGSVFLVEQSISYREILRERTLYVKYLEFLFFNYHSQTTNVVDFKYTTE